MHARGQHSRLGPPAAAAAAAVDTAALISISFLSSQQRKMNFPRGLTPDYYHLRQCLTS